MRGVLGIKTITMLLAALLAVANAMPAGAEMTETDEAGRRAFAACLDGAGNDEEACLKELGYYAWYPRDAAACEAVGALVRLAIDNGGQAEWRDLFLNERCARIGMPHDRGAAAAGDTDPDTLESSPEGAISRKIFVDCLDGKHWNDEPCFEKVGRHRWYDEDIYCAITRDIVEIGAEKRKIQSWKLLFENERCHRRGVWHYERAP